MSSNINSKHDTFNHKLGFYPKKKKKMILTQRKATILQTVQIIMKKKKKLIIEMETNGKFVFLLHH
jgi:hypothetical protein